LCVFECLGQLEVDGGEPRPNGEQGGVDVLELPVAVDVFVISS